MDERATIADLERRLAESETRRRRLIESWAQAVWETDADGVVVADSPSWRAYTGQRVDEWLGYGWLQAIHPDDRAYAERQWREAMAARGVVDAEFRLRAPDGGWRWTNVRAAPVLDRAGRIEKWAGINIDIDARKRAEAALRESEERYRSLFNAVGQGLAVNQLVRDGNGRVIDARFLDLNPAYEAQTGFERDRAVGRLAYEIFPAVGSFWLEMAERVVATRKAERVERFNADTGRWFAFEMAPLEGTDQFVVLYENITDRKQAEVVLRESEERQAFLLKLSDALRPLANPPEIIGAAVRLLCERVSASRTYYAEWPRGADYCEIRRDHAAPGLPSLVGRYPNDAFRSVHDRIRDGRTWVVEDVADGAIAAAERDYCLAHGVAAWVDVPLVKAGELRAALFLVQDAPRRWTAMEIALAEETAERTWAAVERAHAEAALRESEERQAFLLKLSDALRPLADAGEIQATTARLLGAHLGVDRAMYAEVTGEPGAETGAIRGQFIRPAAPGRRAPAPFPDRFTYETFGADVMARRYGGEGLAVADVNADQGFDATERAAWARVGVRAAIVAPLVKGDRLVAELGVHSETSRAWTDAEVSLVREVGERTWAAAERARAEAASRASEERFRQFADASAAGLWIRAADTLAMEFVSPAMATIYGVGRDALLGEVTRWAALIVPEDRDAALAHLEQARSGDVAVHEFRIQRPSDGVFRWIRHTEFPLRDGGQIPRIGGITEDVTEAKLAAEHSSVLLAELQHRVRNIMALLRSITNRTGDRAESVPEYRDLMMGRLLAFARVQALLTRTANVSVGVASIVRDEVSVQAQHEGQYILDGPDVALSPKAAEVLTLAIHELTTNAVKYGALSVPDGKVTVRWSTFEKRGGPWLALDWNEEGAPARPAPAAPDAPRRRGFGSELIEGRIPYELKGRGQITIGPGGARCHLEFPLQGGSSILETGAPQRATVFGGAIDVTGEPDLTGRRVLVVEDDYYLASDTARALRGAGAEVMGPCATEEDARIELEERRPDAVVVDINLGQGPSFKLAEALKDRGIPFVFTTGYDAEVIPAEFEGVERLEKPLQLRKVVGAVAKLTAAE